MAKFCVGRRVLSNGDYEVHNLEADCPYLPNVLNQIPLGDHETCQNAVIAARVLFETANGCYNCATGCHVLGGVQALLTSKESARLSSGATSPRTSDRRG